MESFNIINITAKKCVAKVMFVGPIDSVNGGQECLLGRQVRKSSDNGCSVWLINVHTL